MDEKIKDGLYLHWLGNIQMPQSERKLPDKDSKSQRKRDMLSLQKIGQSLIALSEDQLIKMNLPDTLLSAIQHLKSLTAHEAKRRQLQYVGKIMREMDIDSIKFDLKRIQLVHDHKIQQFHQAEEWREKLIVGGDAALNAFLLICPQADRQQLRQLIRKAQQDRKNDKNTGAEKLLFTYLSRSP